jgi:hypothetical protein
MFFAAPALPSVASPLVALIVDDIGQGRPADCPSRWCACYLEKALAEAGLPQAGTNLARDFAEYGEPAAPATVGSIMVMRGHVGVVAGQCEDGSVQLLSGNHGRKVGVGCYPLSKAIAWRMPSGQEPAQGKRRTLTDIFRGD